MVNKNNRIFPKEYNIKTLQYIEKLNQYFQEYDVIIFMARKAICFYKSLEINNLVEVPNHCRVFSSRVLSYNIIQEFEGKRVLVVDDVVVRGSSLLGVREQLNEHKIKADYYFAACTKSFYDAERNVFGDELKKPDFILSEEDTLSFAKYITEYIETSMCPYNIDQPIYSFKFNNESEINDFLLANKLVDITSTIQKRFDINNYVINFIDKENILFSRQNITLSSFGRKIRLMYKNSTSELILIPFVLLPELQAEELNEYYKIFSTPKLDQFILNNDKFDQENKYKFLHYILSIILMEAFIEEVQSNIDIEIVVKRLDSNDDFLFGDNLIRKTKLEALKHGVIDILSMEENSNINKFEFSGLLDSTYSYLFSNKIKNEIYTDENGRVYENELLVLSQLKKYLEEKMDIIDDFSFSNIIDILIDKGFLIPSILHNRINGGIVRAYKCGEVYRLTLSHFQEFANMLRMYYLKIERPLRKTELEKLCVLFFREFTAKSTFDNVIPSESDEEFGVVYCQYGPRVSTSEIVYSSPSDSVLVQRLQDLGYLSYKTMNVNGRKIYDYSIKLTANSTQSFEWEIMSTNFAICYSIFEKKYYGTKKRDPLLITPLVQNYLDLLVLLSIGLNQTDQLYSLLAEVYLFCKKREERDLIEFLSKHAQIILSGLVSGAWKYLCYSNEVHPLYEIYKRLATRDASLALSLNINLNPNTNIDPKIPVLIERTGLFIFETMYTIYYICRKYNIDTGEEYGNLENTHSREFMAENLTELRDEVSAKFPIQASQRTDSLFVNCLTEESIFYYTLMKTLEQTLKSR
jgi:hypothetical protein